MFEFKRSSTPFFGVVAISSLLWLVSLLLFAFTNLRTVGFIVLATAITLWIISLIYAYKKPYFHYRIRLYDDSIVFKFSWNDYRSMSRHFSMYVRGDEILLSDFSTGTRFYLCYDNELLKFLNKAQIAY